MKKILFILVALVYGHALLAQDIITLRSGEEIKAKVQEIGTDNVKYKKYDNLSGPIYTLMKSEIFMIKYENGDKDIFKETESKAAATSVAPDQPRKDTLSLETNSWTGEEEIVDASGIKLGKNKIRSIMSGVPGALEAYNSGSSLHSTSWFFIGASISCLLSSFTYGHGYWAAYDLGALGCLVAAGLFINAGNSKYKSAVEIYNNAKNSPVPSTSPLSLNFGLTRSGGIGFTLNF